MSDDVHALVQDLLPVLVPTASFDPSGEVSVALTGDDRLRFSTRSLVDWCREHPHTQWPQAVDQWLRQMQQQAVTSPTPRSLEGLGPQLRARMVPRMEPELAPAVVHRSFTEELDLCLTVDYPALMMRVTTAMLSDGDDQAALLTQAITNTVTHELTGLDDQVHAVGPLDRVRLLAADDNSYVATGLMIVHHLEPAPLPYGALVAAPSGSTLLIYRVETERAVGFSVVFRQMVASLFRDAPDPLSTAVYWWLEGVLHRIDFEPTDDPSRPTVLLSPALEAIVARLPVQPS